MNEKLKDILMFKQMITPLLIQIIFWGFTALTVISGIWSMFTLGFFRGLAFIIFGPIAVRLMCETMIVVFKIHETLIEIKNK